MDQPNGEYPIKLDSSDVDIERTIVFKSVLFRCCTQHDLWTNTRFQIVPAHYSCALNGAVGALETLVPNLFWANAVPDAETVVDLRVKDVSMHFTDGVGYHDKNCGNQSIIDGPRYWDCGHGRFGPYSVVWYNLLDYAGDEHRRAYVVEDGEVLIVSCNLAVMQVRQKGGKAAWPQPLV